MKVIQSSTETNISDFTLGHPQEKCLFFDIETTGLSPRASSLYLIGALCHSPADKLWKMTQWFADKHGDEAEIIRNFLVLLEQYDYLYHFNGKTFDIPYLLHKCTKYQIELTTHANTILRDSNGVYSIDLLARIRPLKKLLHIPKANQTELELWLGIEREDKYSGGELIPIYSQYMQERLLHPEHAVELEEILLLHNHDDMEGMLAVCRIMNYRHLLELPTDENNNIQITGVSIQKNTDSIQGNADSMQGGANRLRISFRHHAQLPKKVGIRKKYPVSKNADAVSFPDNCTLALEPQSGSLEVPIIQTELKYFLPNPEDYYYLPVEDQVVHKSIASFVEASHRKKATASNCYLRRNGSFLPSLRPYSHKKRVSQEKLSACGELLKTTSSNPPQTPLFMQKYRDKLCFYELPEQIETENAFWKEYLLRELAGMTTQN